MFGRRRAALLVAWLAAASAGSAGGSTSSAYGVARERARGAILRKDFDAAEGHIRDGIAHEPTNAHLRYLLAMILAEQNRADEAEREFRVGVKLDPSHVFRKDVEHFLRHDTLPGTTTADFVETGSTNSVDGSTSPVMARIAHQRGHQAFEEQDIDTAKAYLREAITLDPMLIEARLSLGNLLRLGDDHDEMEVQYRESVARAPTHVEALVQLGDLLGFRGEYEEAESFLRKGIARDPAHAKARYILAWTIAQQNRHDEAEQELRAGVDLDASHSFRKTVEQIVRQRKPTESKQRKPTAATSPAVAAFERGRQAWFEHRSSESIDHLREAIALDPNSVRARYTLAFTLFQQERDDEAKQELKAALKLNPSHSLHKEVNQLHKEVKQLVAKGISINNTVATAVRELFERGRLDRTVAGASTISADESTSSDDAAARAFTRGQLAIKRGDLDEGEAQYRECVALDPTHVSAHVALGHRLHNRGNFEAAELHYREALVRSQRGCAADGSRRRRGWDVNVPWRRVTPRLRRGIETGGASGTRSGKRRGPLLPSSNVGRARTQRRGRARAPRGRRAGPVSLASRRNGARPPATKVDPSHRLRGAQTRRASFQPRRFCRGRGSLA